ncbi:MAG: hypothetical protein WC777_05305 [Candidatus Gracilibacteria bacterium]|jgi:hypothetical protein
MKNPQASVALISILIISAFTLLLLVATSISGLSNADQSFNFDSSKISYYGAEACLEEALLRTEQDAAFTTTTLSLDEDTTCSVTVSGANPKTVLVTVDFLEYSQSFQATVSITQNGQIYNNELLTWEEI